MSGTIAGGETKLSTGIHAVSVVDIPEEVSDLIQSWQLIAGAELIQIEDILIGGYMVGPNNTCYLVGGEYRCRTDAAQGSALHFAIVDRDNKTGAFPLYGLSLTKLMDLTSKTGTISVGDTVHGDTSGTTSQVLAIDGDDISITYDSGWDEGLPIDWIDGEDITFKDGDGDEVAWATMTTWDEGDVIEILRHLRDEWIEGYDQREIRPGGAKPLPAGYYFRVICYNAHTTNDLRVKISLTLGVY